MPCILMPRCVDMKSCHADLIKVKSLCKLQHPSRCITVSDSSLNISVFVITDCNKDYTGPNGRVTSPGYPIYYHDVHDCQITITAPSNSFLALYFTEFNVEYSSTCQYDKLSVSAKATEPSRQTRSYTRSCCVDKKPK